MLYGAHRRRKSHVLSFLFIVLVTTVYVITASVLQNQQNELTGVFRVRVRIKVLGLGLALGLGAVKLAFLQLTSESKGI